MKAGVSARIVAPGRPDMDQGRKNGMKMDSKSI